MTNKDEVISFWDNLYKIEKTPWDQGGVPDLLKPFVEVTDKAQRVLVPGCGSAYEVGFLADAGFDVRAVDISEEAVARAKKIVGEGKSIIEQADFFELADCQFDLIYERAFLCSFSPGLREDYLDKCAELLSEEGLIFGFFFVADERESGPPYPISRKNLDNLLGKRFELIEEKPNLKGLDVFAGNEKWQVWKKKH